MPKADSPFLADWLAISLRWLVLLGAAVRLAQGGTVTLALEIAFALGALWNLGASILAILNRRIPKHRLIFVGGDFVLCMLLFVFSGGLAGSLWWIGYLVVFTSSIYYEWRGSVIMALALTLLQGVYSYRVEADFLNIQKGQTLAISNLVAAVVLGTLSIKLMNLVRSSYFALVRKRREADFRVQLRERNRHSAMYRMIEELSATLNYQTVLETALDLCKTALDGLRGDANALVNAVLLFDTEERLCVEADRRFPPPDRRVTFAAKEGALAEALQTAEPVVVHNPARDAELKKLVVLYGCDSALLLPLRRGLESYGIILLAHPRADFFTPERVNMVEVISHQAMIAIQNALLFRDIEVEKERIAETQEEARKKLARDLHDGPTQAVSAIAMRLGIVRGMIRKNPAEAELEAGKIEELARHTSREIRHMLFTLRPLALESQGLKAALEATADKMWNTFQQKVTVDVEPRAVDLLKPEKQTVVFYLVEEALHNARKYAQAPEIRVRLQRARQDDSFVVLQVNDNGAGFDMETVMRAYEGSGSLGMVNLRERAELINAQLRIDSAPGKGTRIQAIIPVTEEAIDRLQRGLAPVDAQG
ncbi:MAG: GAF domain-containing sensor histidine kinase [Anaerolineaceae bacterium]|nr:GAF domain-containing sensor histidine kinase [Anaerolineaceae bacterium]